MFKVCILAMMTVSCVNAMCPGRPTVPPLQLPIPDELVVAQPKPAFRSKRVCEDCCEPMLRAFMRHTPPAVAVCAGLSLWVFNKTLGVREPKKKTE